MSGSRLVIVLFFLVGLLIPSQLGKHVWPPFSLIDSQRIDYLAPVVYITDILLIALILLSPSPVAADRKERLRFPVALMVLVSVNVLLSHIPVLSFLRFARLALYFLSALIIARAPHFYAKAFFTGLAVSLVWVSLLGVKQYSTGASIGGVWSFLGERPLSLSSSLVAKTSFKNSEIKLRPYATLPHPNALAGFIVVTLLILMWAHSGHKLSLPVLIFAGVSSLPVFLLTFSLGGYISAAVVLVLFLYVKRPGILSFIVFVSLIFLLASIASSKPSSSLLQRQQLLSHAFPLIVANPIHGVGFGAYVQAAQSLPHQPVHNIFLLSLAELGLPLYLYSGLKFVYLIRKHFTAHSLFLVLGFIAVGVTGMVDHYWLTLPQNQLLLCLLVALFIHPSRQPVKIWST